jgi:abhydrolase domain-containing protein 6
VRPAWILALLLAFAPAPAAGETVSRWVDVDGTVIHFLEHGRAWPADPVLVMVHGWCGSADDFGLLLPLLPDDLRAISVDLPGCGLSEKPDAVYDTAYFTAFLRGFCDVLGLTRIVLAGHSMGGQFVAHFAAARPAVVERVILVDPYGLKGEEGGWASLAKSGGFVDFAFSLNNRTFIAWGLMGRVLYRPPQSLVDRAADSTARSILGPDGVRAISRITRNVIGHDIVEAILPGIAQPVLLIWGNKDEVLPPRWAQGFLSLLPDATLVMIPDSGHMPMLEKPAEVAGLFDRFIPR